MIYEYYIKKPSYEHMLNCYELAKIYGIYTVETDKPHSRFVAALLKQYYNAHPEAELYYYQTKNGLMQVHPKTVYQPILEQLIVAAPKDEAFDMGFPDRNKVHHIIIK